MTNPAHPIEGSTAARRVAFVPAPDARSATGDDVQVGSRRRLLALDVAATLVIVATYAQLAPPELLFHVVFVILTAEAFLYGRRVCFERIAAVSVALLVYASLPTLGAGVDQLELTEWPLMFTIAVLVAWMADREKSVGRRYASLYQATRDRLVRAEEEERGRLARDLHDGIGQTLTALTLTLDAATAAGDDATRDGDLTRARALALEAIDETRNVSERIHPARLTERGLASTIRAMASAPGGRIEVVIGPDADIRLWSQEAELETYRIAQEAVRNAIDHAAANHIRVALDREPDGLRLEILDDGRGFDPATVDPHRLGLVGMRERAAAIGAAFRIVSEPGRGTLVRLTLPDPIASTT